MQLETDHVGNQHGERLAEHGRLGFNASHPPAEDAEPIYHRGVGIGSHQRIRVSRRAAIRRAVADHASQIFEIYLMADAHIWRHNLKIPKSVLSPTEKLITLHVALKLHLGIKREGHVT